MENNNEQMSSMYMKTLQNQKKKFVKTDNYFSLSTSDIDGARSRYIEKPKKVRETFNNRNDDIEKSHSRVIIPTSVNKPDRQLEVDDIDGTRTKVNKFTSTRKTNPLNPVYQLPQVYVPNPPSPKFIKDNLHIDDIEGTRIKQTFALKMERKGKIIQKQPVMHSTKNPTKRTNNFILDVSDINCKENLNKSKRCTNPLNPTYIVPTDQVKITKEIGQIQGNKPTNKFQNFSTPLYSLITKDIQGAESKKRKDNNPITKEEIQGAKATTLRRGMSTKRQTNPLQPKYTYLGSSEARPKTAVQRFDAFIY